ncbi:M14 family metallopeptidase [Thermohalobacter berrensis]|uniref:Peptidase M14 n=1 Tax=Thermohalobacter berrensis TaxID=99594 RepID=A0A419SZ70_9FIRM|nr:M14 family metallopeptidase [Thermohalobacter berrensis]RKD30563.1 peptidase M14 [Thermohalobacter berrensis]
MRVLRLGSTGTDVMEIQSLLDKIGYNPGPIDGIFGYRIQQAVINFQRDNGLVPDGIVGPRTYSILERFLLGYDNYVIRPGDTLYDIARRYYTQVDKILTANPGLNPYNLTIGREIVVPYGIDVVDTDIEYTHEIMERDIRGLQARYPFLEVGSIGNSVLGRELYYIKLGNGPNEVFYNGAHHALEWITVPLLMKFIENFSEAYAEGSSIRGYDIRDIWNQSTIYIVPMVNPDGIDLVLNGLQRDNPYYEELLEWNDTGLPFSQVWQANIRGVDLNHNYNALWELSKEAEPRYGVDGPGPTRYSGPYPESEPESSAVANFTRQHNFRLVLAYHSQGEVIFWDFQNMAPPVARRIGELLSQVSGYRLAEAYGIASYAGYKDWFIYRYGKPGYTIEVGRGRNPLPITQFDRIYNDNEELLILASVV